MSRMGRKPVSIGSGIEVSVDGCVVSARGPVGELSMSVSPLLSVERRGSSISLGMREDSRRARSQLGMQRALLVNMIRGVSRGFEVRVLIVGVGYRAVLEGRRLQAIVGKSHVEFLDVPEGVEVDLIKPTELVVRGADKQKVGEFASSIRLFRPVEPYKGKGIRFEGQDVVRKEGKRK